MPYEVEITKTDLALKDKRKNWHESLSKDLYVEEALNILEDLNGKQPEKTTMLVKVKPKNGKVVKL